MASQAELERDREAFAGIAAELQLLRRAERAEEHVLVLEETLREALDYVPDYFREKWKLDDPLKPPS